MAQVKCLLLLIFWLTISLLPAIGSDQSPEKEQSTNKSGSPIVEILANAQKAKQHGDLILADSLADWAIAEARLTYEPEPLLKAYLFSVHLAEETAELSQAKQFVTELEDLISRVGDIKLGCDAHIVLGGYYLATYEHEKALEHGYLALGASELIKDEKYKVRSLLILGKALEAGNRKMEAFRNYHNAMAISSGLDDKALLRSVYTSISRFYNFHNMYDQAVEYKLKEADLLKSDPHVDSLALMWILYDLEGISLNSRAVVNLEAVTQVIEFAANHDDTELLNSAHALMRTYFISNEKIEELYNYYQDKPHFLESLEEYNYLTYIRLMAIFKEHEGDFLAAMDYFREAEELIEKQNNPILKSHFYLRFAEFLHRSNMPDSAISKARLALIMAEESEFLEYSLKATDLLETLHFEQKDFKLAHAYSRDNRQIGDSIREIARSEDLMGIEIENAARMQEMEAERLAEQKRRRNNIQYTAFTIAILSLFVILIMLGSFRVPKWSIQALGFFAFIFFFEFIILIADTEIHHMTHGEPWKILGIKVVLIAILLPFHHWLEHRVVSYLIKKRMINISDFSLRKMFQNIWGTVFKH